MPVQKARAEVDVAAERVAAALARTEKGTNTKDRIRYLDEVVCYCKELVRCAHREQLEARRLEAQCDLAASRKKS